MDIVRSWKSEWILVHYMQHKTSASLKTHLRDIKVWTNLRVLDKAWIHTRIHVHLLLLLLLLFKVKWGILTWSLTYFYTSLIMLTLAINVSLCLDRKMEFNISLIIKSKIQKSIRVQSKPSLRSCNWPDPI